MIRVPCKDRRGAIELLDKDDAGEAVRQSHMPEREFEISGFQNLVAMAVGTADQKRAGFDAAVGLLTEKFGENIACVVTAFRIKRDFEA